MKVMMNNRTTVWLGTSGFSYADWVGNFYPESSKPTDWLASYAERMACVELDVTFYRIPTKSMIDRWRAITPDEFKFAAKFPQTVTHGGHVTSAYNSERGKPTSQPKWLTMDQRKAEAEQFLASIRGLKEKLGPLLLQFPYAFTPDHSEDLLAILDVIPDDLQIAVEFRNRKWCTRATYELLTSRKIPFTQVDHPWMPKVDIKTGRFHYLRMLGDHKVLTEDFSHVKINRTQELSYWTNLLKTYAHKSTDTLDIFVFFNNHFSGHAPTTLMEMKRMLEPKG